MRRDLSPHEKELIALADEASQFARCAYSHFRVGAVCESDIGVFYGCNIENASYGLSCCAERVALFGAVSAGAGKITSLTVICKDARDGLSHRERMCCGACRQVMLELLVPGADVIIAGVGVFTLEELLPEPFMLGN